MSPESSPVEPDLLGFPKSNKSGSIWCGEKEPNIDICNAQNSIQGELAMFSDVGLSDSAWENSTFLTDGYEI